MNKPLDILAQELESEIKKIHKMVIDLPEEFLIKKQMVKKAKEKYHKKCDSYLADLQTQDSDKRYDGKNPRDFFDHTQL